MTSSTFLILVFTAEVKAVSGLIPVKVMFCYFMHILSSSFILYLPFPLILGVLTSCPCVLLYVLITAALPWLFASVSHCLTFPRVLSPVLCVGLCQLVLFISSVQPFLSWVFVHVVLILAWFFDHLLPFADSNSLLGVLTLACLTLIFASCW